MWEIQIRWNFAWITVQKGFKTRQDAEWAAGLWKQENRCLGDPFRTIQSETCREPDGVNPCCGNFHCTCGHGNPYPIPIPGVNYVCRCQRCVKKELAEQV